jgi:hypothetical protein
VCSILLGGADAVVGDEGFGVRKVGRDAGSGDWFAAIDARGDFEVEVEELLQQVFLGGEAVGCEYGVVECGVRVLERILAGKFECAIHSAEAAFDFIERFVAHAADFAAGGGDSFYVLYRG